MKTRTYTLLTTVLAVGLSATWVAPLAAGQQIDEDAQKVFVVKIAADVGDGEPCVVIATAAIAEGEGDGEQPCVRAFVVKTGDGGEQHVKCQLLGGGKACSAAGGCKAGPCVLVAGGPADPSRGWLGVSLSEVSPALAVQLDLDEGTVMIANVVEDSPAEAAGLERYDVFISIDGEPVAGSISGLAQRIGELGPGTTVNFGILRGGAAMKVSATLGSRPDELQWAFEGFGPSISDKFHSSVRVLMRGPDGDFEITDLGDLKELAELPESILSILPRLDNVTTQIWVNKGDDSVQTHITTRIEEDGETLEIEQQDGQITVRRTTTDDAGDSQTVEAVYDNAEELEEADPEAYEALSSVQGPHVIDLDLSGLSGLHALRNLHLNIDLEDLDKNHGQWSAEVHASLEEAHKAFQEAMKNVDLGAHLQSLHAIHPFAGSGGNVWFGKVGKATQTFTVNPDGQIEITLRKGDSEVITIYEDEADLQDRNPEMYEKYTDVVSTPVEE